jgi:acetyl esterase
MWKWWKCRQTVFGYAGCWGVTAGFLLAMTGCQTSTETYRGAERNVDAPSTGEVKQAMAATKSRARADMQAVLNELEELGPKPIESLSAKDAREQPTPADAVIEVLDERDKSSDPLPVGRVQNLFIPGPGGNLPIRMYTPDGKGQGPFPIIVYYHGGGWVLATVDTYDASARALSHTADAIVISVEYRKAPEHKFPAAHEDAFAAYQWALRHAATIGGDSARVAVAGESAGGNLAAAVCLMARARSEQLPVHQALIYPVAGYNFNTPSYQENAQAKPLNRAMMAWFFEKYLRDPDDGKNPWISLVDAPDLSGLPPATIITAEIDPLRSEGERYADRLRDAGVPVTYRNFDGVTHEFFGMGAVLRDAKQAARLVAKDLNKSFDRSPVTSRLEDRANSSQSAALAESSSEATSDENIQLKREIP